MTRIIHPVARTVHLDAIGATVQFDKPSRMWPGLSLWNTAFRFTVGDAKGDDRSYWGTAFEDGDTIIYTRDASGSTTSLREGAKLVWREAISAEALDLIHEARTVRRKAAFTENSHGAGDHALREHYRALREGPVPEPAGGAGTPGANQRLYGPWAVESRLLQGDPLNPASGDLIAQTARLNVGEPVPEGWRVLTGDEASSLIARVVLRYELED